MFHIINLGRKLLYECQLRLELKDRLYLSPAASLSGLCSELGLNGENLQNISLKKS